MSMLGADGAFRGAGLRLIVLARLLLRQRSPEARRNLLLRHHELVGGFAQGEDRRADRWRGEAIRRFGMQLLLARLGLPLLVRRKQLFRSVWRMQIELFQIADSSIWLFR